MTQSARAAVHSRPTVGGSYNPAARSARRTMRLHRLTAGFMAAFGISMLALFVIGLATFELNFDIAALYVVVFCVTVWAGLPLFAAYLLMRGEGMPLAVLVQCIFLGLFLIGIARASTSSTHSMMPRFVPLIIATGVSYAGAWVCILLAWRQGKPKRGGRM